MNLRDRIRGNIDKRALCETGKDTSDSGLVCRLHGGARFVRGRLFRLRRKSLLLCARAAAAFKRGRLRFTETTAPMYENARARLSPRLSRFASTVRLVSIAVAVIVGSPVASLAARVSAKFVERFGVFAGKACLGAGGLALATVAVVCVLSLPVLGTPEAPAGADASAGTIVADEGAADSVESADSADSAETADIVPENEPIPAVWELRIDGLPIVTLASQTDAEAVLERVTAGYLNNGSDLLEASIKEDIQIGETPANSVVSEDITDVDAAVSYILTGTKEPRIYTVQSGDTVWEITRANGISQDELVKSNPGLIPHKLKIGQQLNLYETKPYLTIRTVEVANEVESIAFTTNYQNSDELYKGQSQVLVAGVPGVKSKQTQITKENGIVVESVELGSVITAEPQPQTSLVGTKPLETFTGSGQLISPLTHIEISSGFGSRGKRRHLGVDMRSPKGSPIYAADGGVVTASSYQGSYGNLIVLNHGNGLETYYAHCESLLVSIGDVVAQGQQIGTVGISGNATGYHLHFEVRVNGVYQNPLNYF